MCGLYVSQSGSRVSDFPYVGMLVESCFKWVVCSLDMDGDGAMKCHLWRLYWCVDCFLLPVTVVWMMWWAKTGWLCVLQVATCNGAWLPSRMGVWVVCFPKWQPYKWFSLCGDAYWILLQRSGVFSLQRWRWFPKVPPVKALMACGLLPSQSGNRMDDVVSQNRLAMLAPGCSV